MWRVFGDRQGADRVRQLLVGSAASRALGNVSTRLAKPDNGLRMVVWASLVAPLPLLALSLATEVASRDAHALAHASLGSWVSLAYTVGFSTLMAMGIYTALLGKYPADRIVPFNLSIPVVGLGVGYLFMGESVNALTLLGAVVALVGLALVVVKPRGSRTERKSRREAVGNAPAEAMADLEPDSAVASR